MNLPTGPNPFTTISKEIMHTREHVQFVKVLVEVHGVEKDYSYVHMDDDVAVIAVNEKKEVMLVGQWRLPIDQYRWEIPAGFMEEGEEPLESAKRELGEEAGLTAKTWTVLGDVQMEGSVGRRVLHLFLARDLETREQDFDEDEEIETQWVPFDELLEMGRSQEMKDAMTLLALYKTKDHLGW